MTKEQAIKNIIENHCGVGIADGWQRSKAIDTGREFIDEALEQQPSDDCVSRAQAKADVIPNSLYTSEQVLALLDNLSSVTPTIPKGATNGDMIKAIFPKIEIYTDVVKEIVDVEICEDSSELRCSVDWWNTPYDPLDCIPSEYDLFEDMELSNPQMHR